MQLKFIGDGLTSDGWSLAFQSSRFHEFMPGTPYPSFGIALLFYRPERRLSVSLWAHKPGVGWSRNVRLWGPRKLSWEV